MAKECRGWTCPRFSLDMLRGSVKDEEFTGSVSESLGVVNEEI